MVIWKVYKSEKNRQGSIYSARKGWDIIEEIDHTCSFPYFPHSNLLLIVTNIGDVIIFSLKTALSIRTLH